MSKIRSEEEEAFSKQKGREECYREREQHV